MLHNKEKPTYIVVAAIIGTGFALVVTNSAFNVLIPGLSNLYKIKTSEASWLITIYLLAMTVTMPIAAYLSRVWGRKRLFTSGALILFASSIYGALFYDSFITIAFVRLLHGVAAGIMIPLSLVLLFSLYPQSFHGRISGLWGLVLTAAPAIGPFLGGVLMDLGKFHYLFWFMVPFALFVSFIGVLKLPEQRAVPRKKTSPYTIGVFACSLLCICLGLQLMGTTNLTYWLPYLFLILGIGLLYLFLRNQRNASEPMIALHLFQNRLYTASVVIVTVQHSVMFGVLILFPLMMQDVFSYSASVTGALYIPAAIFASLFAWYGGRKIDQQSTSFVKIGILLTALSILLLAFVPIHASLLVLIVIMAIRGMGMGLSNSPVVTIGLHALEEKDWHDGSALSNTLKRLSSMVMVIFITMYFDLRWTALEATVTVTEAKWQALQELWLLLGFLMIVTLPLTKVIKNRTKTR
ncbi:MFS transporter [Geomicrobium sp. JCM 19055]|uniref:MFS transporter n=1 Tax=Geomicrobium sp. JCM 19055 TaxID=1460649 RepID=UPI00045ED1D7|nr:MFS transporter [Geomicrobium sp. JCM 19055]GAJ97658.1 membrane component of multidrug resistance system [Geomicrobium sp. JCM 19055]